MTSWTPAVVAAVLGWLGLALLLVGPAFLVGGLLVSAVALCLALFVLVDRQGSLRVAVALSGAAGALAGPALLVLGFVLQE